MKKTKKKRDCDDVVDLLVQVSGQESTGIVAKRLRNAGHIVERELPISGLIGIKGTSSDVARIGKIRGVKLVKVGAKFQLPPLSPSVPQ